jgi:phage shock protein A
MFMKRKFINGLLLVALFVGFTGSMVSCKDYDEEKIGSLEGQMNDLLVTQKKDLEGMIAKLRTSLDSCKKSCADFKVYVNNKFNDYVTLTYFKDSLTKFEDGLKNTYYTKAQIDESARRLLDSLKNRYTKAEIDALLQKLENKFGAYYTSKEIDSLLANLEKNMVNQMKQYVQITALDSTIINLLQNTESNLSLALDSFILNSSLKQYVDSMDNVYYNKTINEANIYADTLYNRAVVYIDNQIQQANIAINKVDSLAKKAMERANDAYTLAEEAKGLAGDALDSALVGTRIAEEALAKANANEQKITKLRTDVDKLMEDYPILEGRVGTLETNYGILEGRVGDVEEQANEAWLQAQTNYGYITNLQEDFADLLELAENTAGDVEVLKEEMRNTIEDLGVLSEIVKNNKEEADRLHNEMLETISGLVDGINLNAENIAINAGNISTLMDQMADTVLPKLQKLEEDLGELSGKVQENSEAIETLTSSLAAVKNSMAKFISNIELNGTYNPMFGELRLPLGIQSNVLMAFHGNTSDNGLQFPTNRPAYYAMPEANQHTLIDASDIAMIGALESVPGYLNLPAQQQFISQDGAEGNAGTVYLTINPTNRDFTGTQFELINSNNVTMPITLSPLKKSNYTLWHGYTRGGVEGEQSDNGFYEAKATFKLEDIDKGNRIRVNIQSLKDAVKDLKSYEDGFDLHKLTEAVYTNISRVLQANAIKATWTDEFGTKSVVSQYDLGPATVKPLSFAWGKDLDEMTWGLGLAEDFIDRLIDKACAGFPELRFIDYEVESIEFEDFEDLDGDGEVNPNAIVAKFNVYLTSMYLWEAGPKVVWVNVPTWHAYDSNGNIHQIHPADVRVKIEIVPDPEFAGKVKLCISYDISEELSRLANYYYDRDKADEMDHIREQINLYLDDIAQFLNDLRDIKPSVIADKAKENISEYFDKIYNRYKRYLNPNKYVQPMMLIKSQDGYRRLSRSAKVPAQIKGTSMLLFPTTYTAEIVSPAYKKFLAVTNVSKDGASAKEGDATCKAILDQANAQPNLKQVIDGGFTSFIPFEAKAGYTYEMLYTAVDYAGMVFTLKYYFEVSE